MEWMRDGNENHNAMFSRCQKISNGITRSKRGHHRRDGKDQGVNSTRVQ